MPCIEITYEVNGECHECNSHSLDKDGYPKFKRNGKNWRVHRWIYTQTFGKIPDGLVVRHKCDNRKCINTNHLELGTPLENNQDKMDRNRHRVVVGSEHPFAKLTEKDAIFIYKSDLPRKILAEKFNIGRKAIDKIKLKQRWKHVLNNI